MAGLEIIVGTYEEYTVGYKVEPLKTDSSRFYLKEIFSTHNHTASVRVLATHGKYLASGGSDDRICIFDLESGLLKDEMLHHNGTVNCLTFSPKGDYLFSGSNDGKVSAINTKRLAIDKTWSNAHRGSVLSFAIHPQSSIALTLGSDMNLKTWDLVSGRTLYTRGLRNDPKYNGQLALVEWSPDGQYFALMGQRVVDVISVDTTKSSRTVQCSCKPVSLCWISETELTVGLDDGHLLMFDVEEEDEPEKIRIYESRLKALAFLGNHLATASSSGDISLWKIDGNDFNEMCTTNIGCRPTCMVLTDADKLGLHKYLQQPEDNKNELRQTLKNIHAVGRVTVELEDPVQEASQMVPNTSKKNKRKLQLVPEGSTATAALKKIKNVHSIENISLSPKVSQQLQKTKKVKANMSGVWEEEDVEAGEDEKKPKNKPRKQGLNKSIDGGERRKKVGKQGRRISI
ncbi:p21-activated protein kinase-interacting protein 1-like [Ochlerotatus camptorhynchus]|uniref:p21-activated protein kinase-interacting protein 1-like n=1 Tax=Ochlerotatus camptorhynchus TaxID=644619 RepID=UPI0031DC778A